MKLIVAGITLICWVMSLYKLRDLLRDRGNRPLRHLWLTLVTITLSLSIQPAAAWLDRSVGVLGLARLVSNCLTLVAAAAGQAFLLYMTGDAHLLRRQVRHRWLTMGGCVLVCVALFALTPAQYTLNDPHVRDGSYYTQTPTLAVAPYQAVYLLYLGWAMLQIGLLSTRYARLATRPLLRLGLRLIVTGSILGLGYVGTKVAAMAAVTAHPSAFALLDEVVVAFYAPSILAFLVGATIPSWGPRVGLARVWSWSAAMRRVRQLRPLWSALYRVVPQVALAPPRGGLVGWWDTARRVEAWRVRMTIEILDGMVLLRPWTSRAIHAVATQAAHRHDLHGPAADIAVEAAVLAVAMRAHQQHQPADNDPLAEALPAPAADASAGDQVARLCLIADALQHSPVVRQTLAAVPTPAGEPPRPAVTPPAEQG